MVTVWARFLRFFIRYIAWLVATSRRSLCCFYAHILLIVPQNLIRQYTYRDEYDYTKHPSFQGPQYLLRTHVDHCIETIRLNLMCIGDVTPLLVKIDPSSPNGESPDFDTLHKCRKFDKLQEWMKGHVVSDKLEHSKSHP